ncbi:DUF4335 domain-containing protein [Xenococcus sp. PCC 7305]|uniref:DUF4335 domain-containing protein n=1 Tax=Xenococcus sp. PCC 7305 TaxID=102125 RepID=UPI00030D63B0|nr:DUF4335 domain-containing protein [Xenococcus sp. PCC 7305]
MQIIRRFTPPTCTLEIWGKNSPLSRWTKQKVIKNLGFQLSFDDPRTPEEEQLTISGDREQLEQIYSLVLNYTEEFLKQSFNPQSLASSVVSNVATTANNFSFNLPELASHEFSFEDIVKKNSVPKKIKLSALQLFDLVAALEEYKTHLATIAELEKAPRKAVLPLWTKIAAGLILAVGLTNVAFQLGKEPTIPESAISLQEEPQTSQPVPDELDVIPPQVPETEVIKPNPEPKITEPLSSANTLPPPPAIDLPKPPPDIPNPENYPLPEVGRTVAPEIASFPDLKPPPLEQPTTTSESASKPPQVESNIIVAEEDTESKELEIPGLDAAAPEVETPKKEQIALNPEKTIDDYIRDRLSRENAASSRVEESNSNNNVDLTAKKSSTNISDISQLKEVKGYFEQKWQPPAELTRTLEYRLVLNKNGSIKRIMPIGKASEVYIDRTNLPLRGEAFVSPLQNAEQVTIRLILGPDGDVNTFLE